MNKWRNTTKRKNQILPLIQNGAKFLVFDTETTGLNPEEDTIIQFSCEGYLRKDQSFIKIGEFNTYLNPKRPLPAVITEITGLTDELLKEQPTAKEVADKMIALLEWADVWVGYNLDAFDVKMLNSFFAKLELPLTHRPTIDVLTLARDLLLEELTNFKLQSVTTHLVKEAFSFHDSKEDVRATYECFVRLLPKLELYEEEEKEEITYLKSAHIVKSPFKGKPDVRIKLTLTDGEAGDLYFDVFKQCWCCKKTDTAKQLFSRINLGDLEEQFMEQYGYKYKYRLPEEVGFAWYDFIKKREKENK